MPVPEPSDVEKCVHLNFEDQEVECKKLENDLQRISKAKEKVVTESEQAYLEPFQVRKISILITISNYTSVCSILLLSI